jgi:hypothetical protein
LKICVSNKNTECAVSISASKVSKLNNHGGLAALLWNSNVKEALKILEAHIETGQVMV